MAPNVPYPGHRFIPPQAYACEESCKFDCSLSCRKECCQPEAAAAGDVVPANPPYFPLIQPFTQSEPGQFCPNPCPSTCYPACNVGCCTAALGLPQPASTVNEPLENSPIARSSTSRVLHVTHVLTPVDGVRKQKSYSACASSCEYHCSPACARSGCCDKAKRSDRK